MSTKHYLFLTTLCTLGLLACKKDSEDPPVTPTTGTLKVGWGFHWGGPDLALDSTYTDDFGHAIAIHELRYMVCNMQFKQGTTVPGAFPNACLLFTAEEEGVATLGDLSPATFDSLQITLGLDSAMNHGDPSTASEPLNDTTMHWGPGTTNGYYFLVIEGQVDDDGDGVVDASDPAFSYRCATDGLSHRITRAAPYAVTAGSTTIVHMHIQVNELMAGIDVLNNLTAIGAQPINQQLMDQLVDVLELE